jgi:hypothetical protein
MHEETSLTRQHSEALGSATTVMRFAPCAHLSVFAQDDGEAVPAGISQL